MANTKNRITDLMIDLSVGRCPHLVAGDGIEVATKQGMNNYTVGIREGLTFDQAVVALMRMVRDGYDIRGEGCTPQDGKTYQ